MQQTILQPMSNIYETDLKVHFEHDKMRSSRVCGWYLAKWLEHLTANAKVATILDSISASSHTVESQRQQMKQCCINWWKNL